MKRLVCVAMMLLLLTGCGTKNAELDRVMALRAELLAGNGCTFEAEITADYGDKTYTFETKCLANEQGGISFTVSAPETIAGITGTVSAEGGKLTFDDEALAFELLADGQVTPVSAPWLLVKTLRSGYVTSCGTDGEFLRVSIDDSYEEDALHLDIWLDSSDVPQRAEIVWKERRILSLAIENFEIL